MGLRSKIKGKRGELELAHELARLLSVDARRGRQYCGGPESPDVVTSIPGVHWEVKRCESLSLYSAVDQATSEAPAGAVPVVAHRRNKKPWLVVVKLDDLRMFVVRLNEVLSDARADAHQRLSMS